jgi:hypothetical protein
MAAVNKLLGVIARSEALRATKQSLYYSIPELDRTVE